MRKVWDTNSYIPLIFFGLLLPVTWPFLIVHVIIFDRCDTSNSITDIQQVQAQLKSTNTSTYVQHSHQIKFTVELERRRFDNKKIRFEENRTRELTTLVKKRWTIGASKIHLATAHKEYSIIKKDEYWYSWNQSSQSTSSMRRWAVILILTFLLSFIILKSVQATFKQKRQERKFQPSQFLYVAISILQQYGEIEENQEQR